jgi:hypothetical protein
VALEPQPDVQIWPVPLGGSSSGGYGVVMDSAPVWQTVLGIVGLASAIVGPILLTLWSQRRRARGEEAGADTAKGAESMLYTHGRKF